ncbi:MAG: hypothetical protein NWE76_08785, partial [Candidatus Bathyarchaeota archaeon]|nr:hypothetical protein [Candidatus Bathyarchaeota archaeon]
MRWDEYYRMFRGFWTEQDKSRGSERSRIVSPELSQAIETQVAEIEDAIFGRDRWIDLVDDAADQERAEMQPYVEMILDDFEEYGVKQAISEIFLNGAIYGTGIGKIVVDKVEVPYVDESSGLPAAAKKKKYCVKLVPVSPRNMVIDPNARSIDDALGVAHVFETPLSEVQKKIHSGAYRKFDLTPWRDPVEDKNALAENLLQDENKQMCKIVEWHGLVPERLLSSTEKLFDDLEDALSASNKELTKLEAPTPGSVAENMVEAIVVIVNDEHVARSVVNPFIFGDRSFVAYQHDTVPDRFWGRGVSEKGYNPSKALDAEIRARIDALGYSTHPLMGIDSTRVPRGEKFELKPGKNILTIGNPNESLLPLKFPPPDPHTFQQTQELREMVQRGTGSYELPANVDNSRMAATSMSMIIGSMIKRSRRVLANIERNLLTPLVKKSIWRYIQFDPERYPMKDYRFKVKSAIGIMAREFEQGQLVSLLSTVPGESPAFWLIMKGIYSNTAIDEREQMIAFCDEMLQKSLQPQEAPPDPKAEVDMMRLQMEQQQHEDKMNLEARKLMQQDEMIKAEAERDIGEGKMQTATSILQMVKAETEQLRAQSDSMLAVAKAESERNKHALEMVKLGVEEMKEANKKAVDEGVNKTTSKNSEQFGPLLDELKSLFVDSIQGMKQGQESLTGEIEKRIMGEWNARQDFSIAEKESMYEQLQKLTEAVVSITGDESLIEDTGEGAFEGKDEEDSTPGQEAMSSNIDIERGPDG